MGNDIYAKKNIFEKIISILSENTERIVIVFSVILSVSAILYSYFNQYIILYGDAESHLNIAKRVVDSLTPGIAQLGGIWLPLPHILMVPFVFFNPLWQTGLAGSIVSGLSYIISSLFLYKLTFIISKSRTASFFTFLVFALNPNVLYMQSTPMSELVLIVFFILSSYYFIKFLKNDNDIFSLMIAAFFSFCASLSRYDGWFLVLIEAVIIVLFYLFNSSLRKKMEGKLILFSTLAFFGILLWMAWDFLILGDPLYFTNSQFSAKTQQMNWFARGELPAYKDLYLSFLYYFVTSMENSGIMVFLISILGVLQFIIKEKGKNKFFVPLLLFVPFIFYVVTLYLGQSVIFIPQLTPASFEWNLFNVRYGMMMIPVAAFFLGYLFFRSGLLLRILLVILLFFQVGLFASGTTKVITFEDGIVGLSSAKRPDAEGWMASNYDDGLVLLDDYARTLSIVRSDIPMESVIYVGNKPYWEESFEKPEKYAKWIIMQKGDSVWQGIYDRPDIQARLYKYFDKVYTSPEILIFKKR